MRAREGARMIHKTLEFIVSVCLVFFFFKARGRPNALKAKMATIMLVQDCDESLKERKRNGGVLNERLYEKT